MIEKTCPVSGKKFTITDEDLEFYKKMEVPPPTLCPEERMRRRLSFRNERSLHHRTCDGTGKKIISMYAPDSPFKVYENDYWWGDKWDAKDYGRDFDFDRSFFEQFQALLQQTPKMARIQQGENQNSIFTNCASYNKNCYLLFSSNRNEDCLYSNLLLSSRNCADCYNVQNSELVYDSIDSTNCYEVYFSDKIHYSHNMWHCYDCRNTENCFACVDLWNKKNKYWVLNREVTKEAFQALLKDSEQQKEVLSQFPELYKSKPHRHAPILRCENVSGAYIRNCKNALHCWNVEDLEDCKYCNDFFAAKSCYDISNYGCTQTNELLYECEGVGHGVFNVKFSKSCSGGCQNLEYCYECFKCEDCFGCTDMRNAQYCILNKQYTKETYFELKEKIVEQMKSNAVDPQGGTSEYGGFFPIQISPFAYNQTVAQEYFPLTAETATQKGYRWRSEKNETQYQGPTPEIPTDITEVDDSICEKILTCQSTGKNYKIVKLELDFYRKLNLPIPKFCPEERHKRRLALRVPRKLWNRKCDQCNLSLQSPLDPERPEKIYCESCYLNFIG